MIKGGHQQTNQLHVRVILIGCTQVTRPCISCTVVSYYNVCVCVFAWLFFCMYVLLAIH